MNEEQTRIATAYAELSKSPHALVVLDDLTAFVGALPHEQAAGGWAVVGRLLLKSSALRRDRARGSVKSAMTR